MPIALLALILSAFANGTSAIAIMFTGLAVALATG